MPIHDYKCRDCGAQFEVIVLGTDVPVCATCGSAKLTQLLSALAPAGKSATFIKNARKVAARQGLFSHYKRSERPRS